jgi:Transposase DDE domain
VTLGRQLRRPDLPATGARWCEAALPAGSVYRFLARERIRLFPPELFADLFQATGRRSVPPSILAVVMVLQRLEGLSDREAADRFAKDQFRLDLAAGTVTCPARVTVAIRPARRGGGRARFSRACSVCPLRRACTSSVRGRVVAVHPHEAELAAARARQRDAAWLADYRATRPKVERKLAHLLRRRHGGRRARVRGLVRVAQDFKLPAAAVNLARFATLGLRSTSTGWQVQPA